MENISFVDDNPVHERDPIGSNPLTADKTTKNSKTAAENTSILIRLVVEKTTFREPTNSCYDPQKKS